MRHPGPRRGPASRPSDSDSQEGKHIKRRAKFKADNSGSSSATYSVEVLLIQSCVFRVLLARSVDYVFNKWIKFGTI